MDKNLARMSNSMKDKIKSDQKDEQRKTEKQGFIQKIFGDKKKDKEGKSEPKVSLNDSSMIRTSSQGNLNRSTLALGTMSSRQSVMTECFLDTSQSVALTQSFQNRILTMSQGC